MSDKIYYNANLYNGTNSNILAKFSETKTVPIIEKRGDYYLSVIRFSCPTTTIPVFFYRPGVFYVSLSVGNTNYTTVEVPYKTYIKNPSLPPDNNINIFNKARIFYFQQFIDGINEALQTAINNISIPAGTSLPINFFYDRNSDTIDFIYPKIYLINNVNFYMSNVLYTKFLSVPAYRMEPNTPNIDYQIILYQDMNNDFDTNYYISKQASTVFYWFEWRKIVIKSYNLGLEGENNSAIENGNTINELILTDYELSNSVTSQTLVNVLYNPTAQYRLTSFLNKEPLRTIDYQVFIQYNSGFLLPLELIPGESVNMKILFTRRPNIL